MKADLCSWLLFTLHWYCALCTNLGFHIKWKENPQISTYHDNTFLNSVHDFSNCSKSVNTLNFEALYNLHKATHDQSLYFQSYSRSVLLWVKQLLTNKKTRTIHCAVWPKALCSDSQNARAGEEGLTVSVPGSSLLLRALQTQQRLKLFMIWPESTQNESKFSEKTKRILLIILDIQGVLS